ncbi:MAG TPA: NAD(P)/FAD-dependent oxidoreductase, partial [Bacteroidia bacterium]|nr:NAD(P)/FAD-dependent oxidoreductase [Bacteroidia bacterium]
IQWFKERGVILKAESDGRMFPVTDKSETIINCLLKEAEKASVKIKTNVEIQEIILENNLSFTLKAAGGGNFFCDKLIVATGGNAKNEAYNWLRKLGHSIENPVPSLFTFNIPNNEITQLMGVSVPNAKIKIANTKIETEGPLLITHWGMSGPAILRASAWGARQLSDLKYNFTALINWMPIFSEEKLRIEFLNYRTKNAAKLILLNFPFDLPKRLWEYFIRKAVISENTRWADISKKQLNILISILLNDTYQVQGKTTFKEEFVTCGGIRLKEIDFKTMQSKLVPNLFFAGEIMDVDGITGGFNFQNAWSSAWIAAKSINL